MLNMHGTLGEHEQQLIIERVNAGRRSGTAGTVFGQPVSGPKVIAEKLQLAVEARAQGETAAEAARLVGWSRATLYRYQAQQASTGM